MSGEKQPALKNYYMLAGSFGTSIGVRPLDPDHIDELGRLINEEIAVGFPDTQVVRLAGQPVRRLRRWPQHRFPAAVGRLSGAAGRGARAPKSSSRRRCRARRCRPSRAWNWPSRSCGCTPDDRRLNEVGWSRGDIGTVVRALGDGMFVGEYFDGERRLDMILRASKWDSPEALADTPIATPSGSVLPLGELVHVESTVGAGGLRRVDGHRTIGLNVSPPKELSLGQADRRAQARRRAADSRRPAGRWHGALRGQCRHAARGAVQHGAEPGHRVDGAVPAAGGAVPLGQGQPVRDPDHPAGEFRRRARPWCCCA